MNIGLLGVGRIGRLLAKKIKLNFLNHKITHAFNPSKDKKWYIDNDVVICETEDDFWNADIDAVFICSPSNQHGRQIIKASKKKIPIFCEKPIGVDIDEIQLAIEEIETSNCYVQIGFNRRFDPAFMKLKEEFRGMGKETFPHIVRITSRDPECPTEKYIAESGGIFIDMTIHDFDMARYLSGNEIVEVYSTGSCLINTRFKRYHDVDTTIVQFKYANGAIGIIDNSRQSVYGYDQRIEIFSNKGNYFANNYHHTNIVKSNETGIHRSLLKDFFLDRYDQAYENQLKAFFDCIENKRPSPVSAHDGYQAVKIAQAAGKSLQENRPILV